MDTDYQIDREAVDRITPHLEPNERVLWTGRPGRSPVSLVPLIIALFSLLVFVFVFLIPIFRMFEDFGKAPGIFGYFPVIFIAFGLFFLVMILANTRYSLVNYLRGDRSVFYAVTDKRVLSLYTKGEKRVCSVMNGRAAHIGKKVGNNGLGNVIVIGAEAAGSVPDSLKSSPTSAGWMLGSLYSNENIVFFANVPDPDGVYDLIRRQIPPENLNKIDAGEPIEIDDTDVSLAGAPSVLLPPPPRNVPWYIRIAAVFGNCLGQFGWVFFGFGMVFVWVFTLNSDFSTPVFWGGTDTFTGVIQGVGETNFSSDDRRIYEYAYSYRDALGIERTGKSYSQRMRIKSGDACTVEVAKLKPSLSRIEGMGRTPMGMAGLFVLLFPIIGLSLIVSTSRKGMRVVRLLREGNLAYGKFTHKAKAADLCRQRVKNAPRITEENDRPVYRLYYTFKAVDGGKHEACVDSSTTEDLIDDEFEPIVYNPNKPEEAFLMDSLPGKIRFDDLGRIVFRDGSPYSALFLLILPVITIAGHGWYIYGRFFSR